METTLDEARRCPKCLELGQPGGVRPYNRFSSLHTFYCRNDRCPWFDSVCSIVTVNNDGTVHPKVTHRNKSFPPIPDATDRVQRRMEYDAAQLETGDARIER